jgi:hypothetical protein
MPEQKNGQVAQSVAGIAAVTGFLLMLAGCGSSNLLSGSALDLFSTSSKAGFGGEGSAESAADIECPSVIVRTGAATLMIGSRPAEGDPTALDLRYQATIVRTARECRVNSGIMTMKVGIEGRVMSGPAGGPGTVNVPLRLALVQEGVNPKTILSKFATLQVEIAASANNVPFTHIDPEITFPLPQPIANIDSYVIYVGFDPAGAQQEKRKPAGKPKPSKPRQS